MPVWGEVLQSLRKRLYRLVGVAFFDAVAHAMSQMPVKNHERNPVQSPVHRVELSEDILAWHVLGKHLLYAVQLSNDLLQP